MAASKNKDRISPPLAYIFRAAHAARDGKKRLNLRDEGGERIIAARRTASRMAITEPILRNSVSIDVERLMNTVNFESSVDLTGLGFVQKSIVNFGLPDIAHRTIDETDVSSIVDEIRAAVINFEPRLHAASLYVERDQTLDTVELRIRFFIRADLVCDPVSVPVTFIADLQFETGAFTISQR